METVDFPAPPFSLPTTIIWAIYFVLQTATLFTEPISPCAVKVKRNDYSTLMKQWCLKQVAQS
jgi:hypothetical protein